MTLPSSATPQFAVNYVCSCLLLCKIRTSDDLNNRFYQLIAQIQQCGDIYSESHTPEDCYLILEQAVKASNGINDFTIRINKQHINVIAAALKHNDFMPIVSLNTEDDLSRITKNYDKFVASRQYKEKTNHIILGGGDTATTIWLEKYQMYHHAALSQSESEQDSFIPLLMISSDSGSWKHNYTLAQPHSILERPEAPANPADYVFIYSPYAAIID